MVVAKNSGEMFLSLCEITLMNWYLLSLYRLRAQISIAQGQEELILIIVDTSGRERL